MVNTTQPAAVLPEPEGFVKQSPVRAAEPGCPHAKKLPGRPGASVFVCGCARPAVPDNVLAKAFAGVPVSLARGKLPACSKPSGKLMGGQGAIEKKGVC